MITEFEQEFPQDTINTLMGMILSRNVDKQEFGLALLNIQSYVMGKLLTQGPLFGITAPTHDPSDEEALSALQSLQSEPSVVGAEVGGAEVGGAEVGGPIVTHGLLLVLKWAMKKFLNEYLP